MNITNMNIAQTPNMQSIQGVRTAQQPASGLGIVGSQQSKDTVSFSEDALRLSNAQKTEGDSSRIRFDLVNRIRAEIASGTYDTPDKMDIALERMANRIF